MLSQAALVPYSRLMYERCWKKLSNFLGLLGISRSLPVSVPVTLLLVANLLELRLSPSSLLSIMSAVSYFHKANNLLDPTNAFLVTKAVAGARNNAPCFDIRLPVTPSVLNTALHISTGPLARWLFQPFGPVRASHTQYSSGPLGHQLSVRATHNYVSLAR